LAARGHKNIRGLDVAVNDSLRVRRVQRIRDLDSERQHVVERNRLARNLLPQRSAFEAFHRNERLPIVLADFVNGADVGMIQRGGGFRFTLEASERLSVFRYVARKEFEGYKAIEFEILRFVNHAHTAAADLFDHTIVRDYAANNRGGIGHWRTS